MFAELYYLRWRIEEGFKRLKQRARLECVSGLTQHAVLVDVASKVLADGLGSLLCHAALQEVTEEADNVTQPPTPLRVCNRAYATPLLQRLLPRMVLGLVCLAVLLNKFMALLASNTRRCVKN